MNYVTPILVISPFQTFVLDDKCPNPKIVSFSKKFSISSRDNCSTLSKT